MVAFPKVFAGLSGCAVLLVLPPHNAPSDMLDSASYTDSKVVMPSEQSAERESGWNTFRNAVHHQLSGTSEHQEPVGAHSAQLRGASQMSSQVESQGVNISCAVGVAVYLYICTWIVAWAWGGEQIALLIVHISRQVFDAMLALTIFLPSNEANFAEIIAAILIVIVGWVAIVGHLSCSPRQWAKSLKASLFIFIGCGLAMPHFWIDVKDCFLAHASGIIAAVLVHMVPSGALIADWSFFAGHAKRLRSESCSLFQRWLLARYRQCARCRTHRFSSPARGRDPCVKSASGKSAGAETRGPKVPRCATISAAWRDGITTQKSSEKTRVVDTGAQKLAAAPVAPIVRRNSRAPALPKRRVSLSRTGKENIPAEVRRNSVASVAQKENIPLETGKENTSFEAVSARSNTGGNRTSRLSLQELAAVPNSFKGVSPAFTSSLPIFVDDEFADPVSTSTIGASPEPSEILCMVDEGHQAFVDSLSTRLESIRAFKTHWASGNTCKALPELASRSNHWAHRDIDKVRLLLDNASSSTEKTKAAALGTMRAGVQNILASTH